MPEERFAIGLNRMRSMNWLRTMDNKPSQPASTKPKLTADEELEYLQNFQREQLLPGERGDLVFECAAFAHSTGQFWHIRNAIIEGFAGNVFIGAKTAHRSLPRRWYRQPITPLHHFRWSILRNGTGLSLRRGSGFSTGLIPHRQVTLLRATAAWANHYWVCRSVPHPH